MVLQKPKQKRTGSVNMANANASKLSHVYNPWGPTIIDHGDGMIEQVIDDKTMWHPYCDPENPITHAEYQAVWDEDALLCFQCKRFLDAEENMVKELTRERE
jgi:hypothetical protein